MARYLVQAASNRREVLAAPHELAAWVRQVVEKLGGRLESLDYTIGEEDVVLIVEMPDEAGMAAFAELASTADKLRVARVAALIRPEAARVALSRGTGPTPVAVSAPALPAPVDGAAAEASVELPDADDEPEFSYAEAVAAGDATAAFSMPAQIGDVPPGACALLAGRFTRFSELAAFSETVQALPGIQGVTIQQFLHGMVSMRIHYDSPIPLITRLQELRQFKPEVREIGPGQYEMLIFAETRALPRPAAAPRPAAPGQDSAALSPPPAAAGLVPLAVRPAHPSPPEPAAEGGVPALAETEAAPTAAGQASAAACGLLRPALVRAVPPQPASAASRARARWGLGSVAGVFAGSTR